MKKTVSILLAAAIMLSLAACGAKQASSASSQPSGSTLIDPAPPVTLSSEPVVFEEFTAIESEECAVTVKAVDPHSDNGFAVTLELENKSSDMTYKLTAVSAYINGVAASPELEVTVAPGEKADADLLFLQLGLRESGMTLYSDILVTLKVADADNWLAEPVTVEDIRIYPYGEDRAETFVREAQETDIVLSDNDYVTVIYLGMTKDFVWGYTPKLFILNKSDAEITVTADNAAVNGKAADIPFAVKLMPGTCAFETMYGIDSSLKLDISKLKEISFTLRAHDSVDYTLSDFFSDNVTIHP